MDLINIKKIISLLEESDLKKLTLKEGDFEITLEKQDKHPKYHPHPPVHSQPESDHVIEKHKEISPKKEASHGIFIKSPMVGTFYAAPAPDKPAFVKVGDFVTEDSVVCVVEAMKVMNEVKAGVKGKVVEVLVDNASAVEFATNLFRIES
ncbi:MAG: acetyl-CoA carboxylase biotin carboxyl carrier protein [Parachlamydiales bacterium]|nr:acetyl-CoA carboxylase biotin carboxyl carrier protein [Parachlamydiales bacterium]